MKITRYLSSLLALMSVILTFTAFAAGKPEITSHTVQLLDRAMSINIQWQSENPVTKVKVMAGRGEKEVQIDEYDNRRNPGGYSGETSVVIPIELSQFQGSVSYQIQLEDDLRQRSNLFSGQTAVPMSGAIAGATMGYPPPQLAPGMLPGNQGMGVGVAVAPGIPFPPQGGMGHEDNWGKDTIRAGKAQGESRDGKSNDMVDKMLAVAERFDTPPALEPIKVNVLGPENVSFSSRSNDDKGIKEIAFRVYDSVGNKVGEQILTGLGKKWEGSTQPIKLTSGGNFRVVAQAVDSAGNTSKEQAALFTMKSSAPPTVLVVTLLPQESLAAGVQWQLDGGVWQANAASLPATVGKHKLSFKDTAGWVTPVAQDIDIKEGPNAGSGQYKTVAMNGSLAVTIIPAAAVTDGAQWRLGSGAWQNSGISIEAPAGGVVIEFKELAGWVKPANVTATVLVSKSTDASGGYGKVYTLNSDFEAGKIVGLEDQTAKDQLQLSKKSTTLPFIWVPNSDEGTISKINTETGVELGRYRVGPANADPSRTTVDLMGNCWVATRGVSTAVKIGLSENGQCVDRNNNGKIETSSGSTALAYGEDECALFEVSINSGKTYVPGNNSSDYSSLHGPRGVAIDSDNNVWVSTFMTNKMLKIDGETGKVLETVDFTPYGGHPSYGLVVDKQGKIWSSGHEARHVLRYNPQDRTVVKIPTKHMVYGIGIDRSGHLFAAGLNYGRMTRINTVTEQIDIDGLSIGKNPRSIAVTNDGDVWVTNYQYGSVTRLSNDLQAKAVIQSSGELAGVSVDSNGKVWAVDYYSRLIRINPDTNAIEKDAPIKGFHYSYSDMTGFVARTMTTQIGTWTVLLDGKTDSIRWHKLGWNGTVPQNTALKMRVRTSNDQTNWSAWEDAAKDTELKTIPPGRYIQAESTLQVISGDTSPVLTDLTIYAK